MFHDYGAVSCHKGILLTKIMLLKKERKKKKKRKETRIWPIRFSLYYLDIFNTVLFHYSSFVSNIFQMYWKKMLFNDRKYYNWQNNILSSSFKCWKLSSKIFLNVKPDDFTFWRLLLRAQLPSEIVHLHASGF